MTDFNDELFVIDAVTHPYNHTPENFADAIGAGAHRRAGLRLGAGSAGPEIRAEP